MNTIDLTKEIIRRLRKFRFLILLSGLVFGALFYLYAKKSVITYTARATVFPLNSTQDNATATSLSSILGIASEGSKSFSDEASINIIELAQSRTTRESVAAEPVKSIQNKLIAELILEDINNHLGLLEKPIERPKTQADLVTWAGIVLKDGLSATLNKNGILVITYTCRNTDLVKLVTEVYIDKISKFYIDLKREKARRDYEFAVAKVDSLADVIGRKDARLIIMDKTTLFTDRTRLQFSVPEENLLTEKQMLRTQYAQAVGNRENSAYRLQKATPVIKTLDPPAAPFDRQQKSGIIYGIIGFLLGVILIAGIVISLILWKYLKEEASKALFGQSVSKENTTTTTAGVL